MKKKCIVFDFDGVIADTWAINQECARKSGHEFTLEDFLAHHDRNPYQNPRIAFTKESGEKFFHFFEQNIYSAQPFISQDQLHTLSKKYMLFIISSNQEGIMKKYLSHQKVDNYFQEIFWKESGKSKVQKFKDLFQKYHLSSDDCYFVTDTLGDIKEWHELWIQSLAVSYWYHNTERLQKWNPYKIFHSTEELFNYF